MTTLRHRVLDDQNAPVAGRVATVAIYDPDVPSGVYRRTKVVSATSGADGWLSWTLPSGSRRDGQPLSYVVIGIETHPVLVTPAAGVSTVTVGESRTGVLPIAEPDETDLVTEDELAARLTGITAGLATIPASNTEKEAFVPARLSEEELRAALVPFWAPNETVAQDAVRMTSLGLTIKRNTAGTTRATYDATESALWTVVGGGGGAVASVNGKTGTVVLAAADVAAVPVADAVELDVATSPTLTAEPISTGLAADSGHVHRLPDVDGDGYITLATADGTPIKFLVVSGVVGAGGGGPSGVAPSQVTGLTVGTPAADSVPLTWTAPAAGDQPITDYVVQYRATGATSWSTFADGTGTTTATTVSGLAESTSYDFRVAAVSTIGTGPYSTIATATTLSAGAALNFTDDFNRANGPLGGDWVLDSQNGNQPNLEIISNQAGKVGGDFNYAWAVRDCGAADGIVAVVPVGSQPGLAGIIFRWTDRNNWLALYESNLFKMEAGTRTVLGTGEVLYAAGDTTSVSLAGDTITAYVNGSQRKQVTTTFNQSATKHGLVVFHPGAAADSFSYTGPA